MTDHGHVFWLFGLSGAGKSTLAAKLAEALRAEAVTPLVLDGDALRAGLCRGLGFSDADRAENLRRAAEAARLGVLSGVPVIASFITPHEVNRQMVREIVGPESLVLIHLNPPLAVCQERDVKGLYARAQKGLVPQMTGVSSQFESPTDFDLQIDTATEPIAASADRVIDFARNRLRRAR
jgi:adenylyl-sulfate kinase